MADQINFLRQQRHTFATQQEKDRRIARYTTVGLIVFAVVVIGIVGARIVFALQARKTMADTDTVKRQLQTFATLEKDYIVFTKKIQLLSALDKQRESKRVATQFFYALIPPEDVILNVQLDDKQTKISFQVQSPDVFRMLALLKTFQDKLRGNQIYAVKIENLVRRPDGTYTLTGSFTYPDLEKKVVKKT